MSEYITLGSLKVFPEQITTAHNIINLMNDGVTNIALKAKPQCGKTTTFIYLTKLVMDQWKKQGVKFKIYSVLAASDNTLLSQTKLRWNEAGFNVDHYRNIIEHYHRDQFKKVKPSLEDQKRLIIIDEAHIANKELSTLDKFLKEVEYDYQHGENAGNCENYILSVSATAYSHELASRQGLANFTFVNLHASDHYYGLRQAEKDGRLKEPIEIFEKDKNTRSSYRISSEMINILEEFKYSNEAKNLVIRLSGKNKKSELLLQACEKLNLCVLDFHSNLNNLDRVDAAISIEAANGPTVIIIYGALRAGKTLTTTQHIYAWIDSPRSKSDTAYQSVGRLFGYKTLDGHSKFEDRFPIYASRDSLSEILEYECDKNAPVPCNKDIGKYHFEYIYEPVEAEYIDDNKKYYWVYKINEENTRVDMNGRVVLDVEKYKNNGNHKTTTEYTDGRDAALTICNHTVMNWKRGIQCSGPRLSLGDKDESWNKLMKLYPEFKGKTIVMKPVGARYIQRLSKGLIVNRMDQAS